MPTQLLCIHSKQDDRIASRLNNEHKHRNTKKFVLRLSRLMAASLSALYRVVLKPRLF